MGNKGTKTEIGCDQTVEKKKRRTETCGPDSVNGDRHMAMPLGRERSIDGCIYLCGRVVL